MAAVAALWPHGPAQRLARTPALAVVCALAVAGCGGDDGGQTTASATTSSTTRTASPVPTSDLRKEFNQLVSDLLTSGEGVSPAVARCAVESLTASVTDDELRAALEEQAQTGEVPVEILDAAFDAGVECARE